MNMARELACADGFNQTYLGGFFSDEDLWLMVTRNAARATHVRRRARHARRRARRRRRRLRRLEPRTNHRAVIAAGPADVLLVLRAGKPLYGDAAVIGALVPSGCDALDVCGAQKSVCLMGDIGETLPTLQSKVGSLYAAFFCGTPDTSRPACRRARPRSTARPPTTASRPPATPTATASPTPATTAHTSFNPIRPLDDGQQADADGDGAGDVCDTAPLDGAKL